MVDVVDVGTVANDGTGDTLRAGGKALNAAIAALVAGSIQDGAVTNALLDDMAEATFKMRAAGAGTGAPIDGTATQAKTALALAKADVGLGNVDNTSDANKPVSTAQAAALAGKSDTGHSHSAATSGAAGFMAAADKAKLDGVAAGATANATDAQLRDRATHTGAQAISTVTGLQTALDAKQASLGFTPENVANKGAANGYAPLGADSKIASTYLPSFVDDVLEAASFASLPGTGEAGKIYVTTDNGKTFRWGGSAYTEISAAPGSTDVVPEGAANLYYTDARAQAANAAALASKLPSASYTAADVLAKMLTVDGTSSGLDADKLRGTTPSAFGLSMLDDADAAAARTTLGLAAIAASGSASDLPSGTIPDARLPGRLRPNGVLFGGDTRTLIGCGLWAYVPGATHTPEGAGAATGYGWVWNTGDGSYAYQYCHVTSTGQRWRRRFENSIVQAWERVRETEFELDARYVQSSGLAEIIEDTIGTKIVAGTNISVSYNDTTGQTTLAATGTVSAAAVDVSFTPVGGLASTNVQAALQELDSEKARLSGANTFTLPQTIAGQAGAYDVSLSVQESIHATSRRASIDVGTRWRILQDTGGNGTKDFGIYDAVNGQLAMLIDNNDIMTTPYIGKFSKAILLDDGYDAGTLLAGGTYTGYNLVGMPFTPANSSWMIDVAPWHVAGGARTRQIATLTDAVRPTVWQRMRTGGVWGAWRPVSGFVAPSHFGGAEAGSLSGATTDETAAVSRWIDYGLSNPSVPLVLDGFYKITGEISRSISGVNGFGIRSLGPGARAGFLMSGANGRLTFTGADQSNPSGFDADQYHFSDFMIGVDADRTNHLISVSAAPDSGSDAPGLQMSNIHVRRALDSVGVTGDHFIFNDIRQFDVSNVSVQGKYFAYQGQVFHLTAAADGAPVEGCFTNCRSAHVQKMFRFEGSGGATANDDWQGMHLDRCTSIACDMLVHATTGSETYGFSEWLTVDRCHAYFRELAVYGDKVGNVKVANCYFLGHGALATIQGVALTGTSIVPVVDISHNTIKLDAATGATRIGINAPTMAGVAAHNRIKGATINSFGVLTQTDNLTF